MKRYALLLTLLSLSASAASKPAVVCDGTSLTFGYSQATPTFPQRLATATGRPVANLGIGGARLAAIVLRWQTYAKTFPYGVLVAEGGTNDLALDSANGTTLAATFTAWIDEALAAGQRVVAVTVFPRAGSPDWDNTKETERLAFNAAVRAYVVLHPQVMLVDGDVLLGDGAAPPALRGAVDYGDHLHLNGTGMQDLADAVAALIGSVASLDRVPLQFFAYSSSLSADSIASSIVSSRARSFLSASRARFSSSSTVDARSSGVSQSARHSAQASSETGSPNSFAMTARSLGLDGYTARRARIAAVALLSTSSSCSTVVWRSSRSS